MPTGRVVEYYETVILGILEEMENEEVSEAEEYEVEEDEGKDDSTWASWLKEIYSYIDYIETTYIGKRSVVSESDHCSQKEASLQTQPVEPVQVGDH